MKIKIKKEMYIKHPGTDLAANLTVNYVGSGLERLEIFTSECEERDDLPMDPQKRYSNDNGRTWSDWEPLPEIVSFENDSTGIWGGGLNFYDPVSGVHPSIWLRQTIVKKPERRYYNHCFCRITEDDSKTWSQPQQLTYEERTGFNPHNPLDPSFLQDNQAYPGTNTIRHSNGTLIHCATSINIPKNAPDPNPEKKYGNWWSPPDARDIGSACFIGRWNNEKNQYEWKMGNCVWLPRRILSRGLMEGFVAELTDARVLVIWRGSDTPETPGRKWFSISEDGGLNLSAVKELKYDDGSRFYSPSSIHKMIRYSNNGKLYWIGNICPKPPKANSPRYPLIIAEIDENIPALKKNTVSIIDDKQGQDSVDLQLSNFSLLENRETHELELYLTRLGEKATHQESPIDFWEANCYKYTVSIL